MKIREKTLRELEEKLNREISYEFTKEENQKNVRTRI